MGSENGVRDLLVGGKTEEREGAEEVGWEVIARELGAHEGDVNCVCWRPRCNGKTKCHMYGLAQILSYYFVFVLLCRWENTAGFQRG